MIIENIFWGMMISFAFLSCSDRSEWKIESIIEVESSEYMIIFYTPYDCELCTDNLKWARSQINEVETHVVLYGGKQGKVIEDFCIDEERCFNYWTNDEEMYNDLVDNLKHAKFPIAILKRAGDKRAQLFNTDEIADGFLVQKNY